METVFDPLPVTLVGRHVRLEPLSRAHADDLLAAAQDDDIWLYMPKPRPQIREDVWEMIDEAVEASRAGTAHGFAIVSLKEGRAVGSTRFLDIRREHRALEIGWTWLAKSHHRTAVNTECKLLLLQHAFETLGAVRVQLKTDLRNERSQRAIERLGAVREGVHRKQLTVWNGYVRDSVFYSVIDTEWPGIKARLLASLARKG